MGIIPSVKRGFRWLLEQPSAYDVGLGFFTALVGYSSSVNYLLQDKPWLGGITAIATTAALAMGFAKSAVALLAIRKKEALHDLEGCLYALHGVLTPEWGDGTLRIALHVPVEHGAELEQVTEYVGVPPKAGRIGRRFPSNAGIIGAAYNDNENYVGQRDNEDPAAFVQELINEWGYSEDLARRLNQSVFAWMAVPFNDPEAGQVAGVLYLDSTDREFFTEERQELILQSVTGIARYIGKRYT